MEKLILFGAGQVAQSAHHHFTYDSPFEVVAFTVDREFLGETRLLGLPVVPFDEIERLYPPEEYGLHIALSFRQVNRLRAEKFAQAKAKGYRLPSYISSRAACWPSLALGENCVIGANALVDSFVCLGDNVHIAGGCLVGHHSVVGSHAFLGPGVVVAGSVEVGAYAFLGAGAVVRDRVKVAPASVVGAGALILEDTVAKGVYLGKPADRLPIFSDQIALA